MKGKKKESFMGVGEDNTVRIRKNDQTIVDYSIGWGTTIPEDPYMNNIQAANWSTIEELEKEWLTDKGWL